MSAPEPVRMGIELSKVAKSYGSVRAVRGIDLAVAPGETVALLGPNGAGKSTTIDMILGLSRPDRGTVSVFGAPGTACLKERGRVKRHRSERFDCVGRTPDATTDCQARRRDRRGPGGAPAAKRGRTTLTPPVEWRRIDQVVVVGTWGAAGVAPRTLIHESMKEGARLSCPGMSSSSCSAWCVPGNTGRAQSLRRRRHLEEMGALPLPELASAVSERHAALLPWRQRISPSRRP